MQIKLLTIFVCAALGQSVIAQNDALDYGNLGSGCNSGTVKVINDDNNIEIVEMNVGDGNTSTTVFARKLNSDGQSKVIIEISYEYHGFGSGNSSGTVEIDGGDTNSLNQGGTI